MMNFIRAIANQQRSHLFVICLLLLTGTIVFYNGLHNEFAIDDHAFFDEKMRNIKYLPLQFIPDKNKYLHLKDQSSDAYYRPLAHIVPMLAFLAFPNDVVGLHGINIVLFALAAYAIFWLVFLLSEQWWLGLLTALFYMVHPINGVMVNYITASIFSVQVMLMALGLCAVLKINDHMSNQRPAIGWVMVAISAQVLALFCHETSMALIFYAIFVLWIKNAGLKKMARVVWPLVLTAVAYFIFRLTFASLSDAILSNYQKYHMSMWQYAATLVKLLMWYFTQLIHPANIILIKAEPVLEQGLLKWLLVGGLLVCIVGLFVRIFRHDRILIAGFGIWVLGFLPFLFATLFRPQHGMMLEPHWFVFSIIGFFLVLARMIMRVMVSAKKVAIACASVMMVVWIMCSWGNNVVWSKEIPYCQFWLQESPGFAAPMFYLAKAYELRNDYDHARFWYKQALAKNYQTYGVLTNLALLDIIQQNYPEAKYYLNETLKIKPLNSTALSHLGTIAFIEKDYQVAQEYFIKAIKIDRFEALPRLNLARCFQKSGEPEKAKNVYRSILAIVPTHEIAMTHLLRMAMEENNQKDFLMIANSLKHITKNAETLTNMGIYYQRLKMDNEARQCYQRAFLIEPRYLKAKQLFDHLSK